ncbi:MAG: ExeM/NucH family extracellular endonuclease [Acidobacteria bacterium]|nr:ExeM/NucH family extracellular endonuclease [Acidobacteriota bacterium]
MSVRHLISTALLAALAIVSIQAQQTNPSVVISQIYGAGGNASATLRNDYVELFNRSSAAVSLNGWSIQYASATGTGNFSANSPFALPNVSLQPGQYFLVQFASGGAVGSALPTPDASATVPNMAGGAGKVILANVATGLACNGSAGQPCNATQVGQIVDLVGYGTGGSGANFFEGTGATPTLSSTLAAFRKDGGCTDTNVNSADFQTGTPAPRNTATTVAPCSVTPVSTPPSATATASTVTAGSSTTFAGTITAGTNPASTGYNVACNLSTVGGSSSFALTVTGTTISGTYAVPGATVAATYSLPCTVADTQATPRSSTFSVSLTVNAAPLPSLSCADTSQSTIGSIQGSGVTSTMVGQIKVIRGVVVGSYQGAGKLNGFYVQDAGDANPATSDGIFIDEAVGGSKGTVSAGQVVLLKGTVAETFKQTVINNVTEMITCGTGTVTPTDITFPAAAPTDDQVTTTNQGALEQYEGMLVRFPQQLRVTDNYDLGRFGELSLAFVPNYGDGVTYTRLMAGSQVAAPGAAANAASLLNAKSRILLDDGSNTTYGALAPNANYPLDGGGLSFTNTLRLGDRPNVNAEGTYTPIVGVLGYGFNTYRLQPVASNPITFGPSDNPRPTTVPNVGGRVKVASANILNYFTTYNSRGANNAAEFQRQRDKIITAFKAMDPAVIAISELENNTTTAINDLVFDSVNSFGNSLNTGNPGKWAYINTGVVGTDQIRVGFIYQPALVEPVGLYKVLNNTVDPRALDTRNRPAIAQTFKLLTGAKPGLQHFTVVANHFKSKGSACSSSSPVDPDLGDGQDNCNLSRVSMARAILDWLATNPTADPTPAADRRFLIVGDLNAHLKEDPLSALTSTSFSKAATGSFPAFPASPLAVYKDLVSTLGDKAGYSYLFSGESGALDHALANPALFRLVTGVAEWHINADEPVVLDYNSDYDGNGNSSAKSAAQLAAWYSAGAFRTSDHDPLLVGFNPLCGDLNDDGIVNAADQTIIRNAIGKPLATVDRRTDFDGDGRITLTDFSRWSACAAAYQR